MKLIILAPVLAVLMVTGAALAAMDFETLYDNLVIKFNALKGDYEQLQKTFTTVKADSENKTRIIGALQKANRI